jgi:anti-sigma factor RsiW
MKQPKAAKTCRAVLLEFSKYLDGEQSPGACRRIERHLQSCHSCAAATDQMRRVVASCRRVKKHRLPEDVRARASQRIKGLLAARTT